MGSMTFSIANISSSLKRRICPHILIYIQINQNLQLLCLISYLLVNPEYQVHAEVDQTTP